MITLQKIILSGRICAYSIFSAKTWISSITTEDDMAPSLTGDVDSPDGWFSPFTVHFLLNF